MKRVKGKVKYFIISFTDVEKLLPFGKSEEEDLQGELKEETRAKDSLKEFTTLLQRKFHEQVAYIGEEKRYGKHLERFMFNHGGFMEIMLETPLMFNAYFLHHDKAKRFLKALKETMKEIIPDSPIKNLFIKSIEIEHGDKDPLTVEKWHKMHNIYLQKSVVYTIIAILLAATFELTKAGIELIGLHVLHTETVFSEMFGAVIVAFLFEPVRKRIEEIVNKFISIK